MSLAAAAGGVAATTGEDTSVTTVAPAPLAVADVPTVPDVIEEPIDPGASVELESAPVADAPGMSEGQEAAGLAASDPGEEMPSGSGEAVEPGEPGVAAPDPTPLTDDTSPLASQLRAQAEVPEEATGPVNLASALLPPMLPDFAAQREAVNAEKERIAGLVQERQAQLQAEAEARAAEEARKADEWVMPLENYRLSARFGQAGRMWSSGRHTGIDLSAPSGTPLYAMQDAVVASTGYAGAYGNRTVLRLADGTELWYAHQSRIDVEPGQVVRKGDRIGAVGATGNVTGPHLHLEVHLEDESEAVDPLPIMKEHGLRP
ncbi:hypothetical protein BHE97_18745 [Aeromicrobium sp. PE09-221]|uniref:M23 family metallopeptidase n=1 Tax=Aeromicrobium sp. PE09-221 TaxID=1898043 RepID=UPI000B7415F0|nr:M23 family metallopeptidase [Aeromicrobium sp. PE09-221]OUZ06654.1 hypothetical protein BHE97_18745 [Aeromicrobium sp. PE09-221]